MKLKELLRETLSVPMSMNLVKSMQEGKLSLSQDQEVLFTREDDTKVLVPKELLLKYLENLDGETIKDLSGKVKCTLEFGKEVHSNEFEGVIVVGSREDSIEVQVMGNLSRPVLLQMYQSVKRAIGEASEISPLKMDVITKLMDSLKLDCKTCPVEKECDKKQKCKK